MRISGKHITTNRWIFFLMVFAFFWLVIGDLITLHQKAIYGFDPFSVHTPFAKTDNGHSSSKTKTEKGSKFDKSKNPVHFDILFIKDNEILTTPVVNDFEFINALHVFLSKSAKQLVTLRGPPLV